MKRPLIVANWKMNTSLSDAVVLANSIKNNISDLDAEIVLCPPFVWLYPVLEELEKRPKNLHLGAQNMWFTSSGPMTGEVSPVMLKSLVRYVIIGHSERRKNFNETNDLVNDKIQAALENGLTPLLCIGEMKKMAELNEKQRGRGRPFKAETKFDLMTQLLTGVNGIGKEDIEKVVFCYEPVWAISKGTAESRNAADGAYANAVSEKIRQALAKKYGQDTAERVTIIYGGSVDEDNIKEFIYQPEINGVLIGGASLNAKEFIKICREAAGRG